MKKTIETYDKYAKEYTEAWFTDTALERFFIEFVKHLKGKRILDVGCGPGHHCKWFKEHGYDIIGIDASKNLIKIAREKVHGVEFIEMDMRDLKFPDESFDGIIACASVLHVPKKTAKEILLDFKRKLKPQGVIFLSMLEGKGEGYMVGLSIKGKRFFALYTEKELAELVKDAGFEVIGTEISIGKNHNWIVLYGRKV